MKRLSKNLKKMLAGLAHQDAGDFMSMAKKMQVLGGYEIDSKKIKPAAAKLVPNKPTRKRIAFLSDGKGIGAPLDYAIEACIREHSKIDLLIHGLASNTDISRLKSKIAKAGLEFHLIQLGENTTKRIIEYVANHPALIFLVTMPDDDAVKVLMDDTTSGREKCLPVPLVLIENQLAVQHPERDAA